MYVFPQHVNKLFARHAYAIGRVFVPSTPKYTYGEKILYIHREFSNLLTRYL